MSYEQSQKLVVHKTLASTMHRVLTELTFAYVTSSNYSTTNAYTRADFLQHGHHSSRGWQAESAIIGADHRHFGWGCLGLLDMVFWRSPHCTCQLL